MLPLLKDTFRRSPTLSSGWHASQHGLLNAIPRHHSSLHPMHAQRRTNRSPASCTSTVRLVRPLSSVQQPSLARPSIRGQRLFHYSRKAHQHPHFPGSQHDSSRTESSTLFYGAVQLAFLGTFLVIYLAPQIQSRPTRTASVSPKRSPAPTSTLDSVRHHLNSVRESIQKHLTVQNLSYRPTQWPPSTLEQCTPYVGYMFAHQSASHLAANSLGFFVLTSVLFPSFGILTTAMTFLAGGVLAAQIDCAAAKAYVNPWNPWHKFVAPLHASPRDPNPNETLGSSRLGASAGLCTLFTVAVISNPFARWRLLLVPVGIPAWMLWAGEVGWEGYSFYSDIDDGIGHSGHLAGHLAGAVLWLAALRWTRYARLSRQLRWAGRNIRMR